MRFGGLFGPVGAQWAASDDYHPQFTFNPEEHDLLLNRCFRRICSWHVPPNWSRADWHEEIMAHGLCAACDAGREFDALRGVPLEAFVYQRVIARAYSHFRREWAYGLRCVSETDGVVPNGWYAPLPDKYCVQYRDLSAEPHHTYREVRDAVASLSETEHQIITHLFWEGQTEAAVAEALGISHQALNKRKWKVFQKLRAALQVFKRTGNKC